MEGEDLVGPEAAEVVVSADPDRGDAATASDKPVAAESGAYSSLADSMQLFLAEVSRYRLLTPDEEIDARATASSAATRPPRTA